MGTDNPLQKIVSAVEDQQESGDKRGFKEIRPAPVHLWNPDNCGDMDMVIKADGSWHYMGSPIGRERLVKLFASVLRLDPDERYYLVTPVEKIGITVDDVPFVAIAMDVSGEGEDQVITLKTNVGDSVTVDDNHPLRFAARDESGLFVPYVHIRSGLDARVNRAVYYDLMALSVEEEIEEGVDYLGVWSSGDFYPIAKAEDLAALERSNA